MAKFITILSIVSSVASILSFIYIYFTQNISEEMKKFNKIVIATFGITLFLSAYLLFWPTTFVEDNVESKITYYSDDNNGGNIIIEEGEFIYTGLGEQSIKYYLPFKDVPKVEIINTNGYNSAPNIDKTSENQFSVNRNFTIGQTNEKYKWVARGKPLKEVQSK